MGADGHNAAPGRSEILSLDFVHASRASVPLELGMGEEMVRCDSPSRKSSRADDATPVRLPISAFVIKSICQPYESESRMHPGRREICIGNKAEGWTAELGALYFLFMFYFRPKAYSCCSSTTETRSDTNPT